MTLRNPLRRLVAAATTAGVALSLVLVSSLTSTAATAAPTSGLDVGVNFHGMWSDWASDADRGQALDQYVAAGMTTVRMDVAWSMIQPKPGAYDNWGVNFVDRVLGLITDRGLEPLVTFWRAPEWARPAGSSKYTPPSNPAQYAAAAEWAARRWASKVTSWQVWNEPNHPSYFVGTDPVVYTRILQAAYPAIKRGNPNAQVVFGGVSYNDTPWLAKSYAAGARGHFDIMATHPYQGVADAAPETPANGSIYRMTHVSAVHDLMAAHGDGGKKIWFTEFGWSTHANWSPIDNWDRGVTEATQAEYFVRTLKMLRASHPYVTNVFWYRDRNGDDDEPQHDNYGLLYRDLRPKPVMAALRTYLSTLGTIAPPTTDPTPLPAGKKKWRRISEVQLVPAWKLVKR